MKHLNINNIIITIIILLLLISVVGVAHAQSGGGYDLTWNTTDGGGGTSQSETGSYELAGTIGQPDAGALTGSGGYTLSGGFWAGGGIPTPPEYLIFLPLVMRNLTSP